MRRPHYAWAICLGGALSLFTVMGLGVNVFSVYQPYIIDLNHFTNAQGSWITTVRSLFSLVAMLTVDGLCRRVGLRRTMALGLICFSLSCFVFGLAGSFPVYCGAAALSGLAYGYGGMIPLSLVVSRWFQDRRGLALGLAAAGSGLSTVVVPPLLTGVIAGWGMGPAFLLEGACILVLAALVFVLVRDCPADKGMQPYHSGGPDTPAPPPKQQPAGFSRAMWWAVMLSAFLVGGPTGPGFSHLTVLFSTEGFDSMTVAFLLSYLGFVLMLAKVLYGQLSDLLGGLRSNYLIGGVCLAGLLLCCLAPTGSTPLALLAMTFTGLGLPISSVTLSVWASDLSGDAGYERTIKWLTVAYVLGSLLAGPIPGTLADKFDSYVPAYALFALFLLAAMAIVQGIYLRLGVGKRPRRRKAATS